MFERYMDLLSFLDSIDIPDTPEVLAACAYSDIIDDISMALVDYRIQHNLSQVDLAKHLSISQTMISQYESGARNISLNTLCTLMAKLGKKVVLSLEDAANTESNVPAIDMDMYTNELPEELALSA